MDSWKHLRDCFPFNLHQLPCLVLFSSLSFFFPLFDFSLKIRIMLIEAIVNKDRFWIPQPLTGIKINRAEIHQALLLQYSPLQWMTENRTFSGGIVVESCMLLSIICLWNWLYVMCVLSKLMQLELTNQIVDNSDFKPVNFDRWFQSDLKSNDIFELTIAISI